MPHAGDADALALATRLFLARHEQALASGEARRMLEAAEGLLEAAQRTLPQELERVGADVEGAAPARQVALKRCAELEGLSLQLRLSLHRLAEGDGDAFRLVALLTAARRTLRALDATLALWARALGAQTPLPAAGATDLLRGARECLLANEADAAALAVRAALAAGLARPLGLPAGTPVETSLARWARAPALRFDPADARALDDALAGGARGDLVQAWAFLDRVERLAEAAATTPPPPQDGESFM